VYWLVATVAFVVAVQNIDSLQTSICRAMNTTNYSLGVIFIPLNNEHPVFLESGNVAAWLLAAFA